MENGDFADLQDPVLQHLQNSQDLNAFQGQNDIKMVLQPLRPARFQPAVGFFFTDDDDDVIQGIYTLHYVTQCHLINAGYVSRAACSNGQPGNEVQ